MKLPAPPPDYEIDVIIDRIHKGEGTKEDQDKVICGLATLARYLASKWARNRDEVDEFYGEAIDVVIRCVHSLPGHPNPNLKGRMTVGIRGALRKYRKKLNRVKQGGLDLCKTLPINTPPDEQMIADEVLNQLINRVAHTDRQRQVCHLLAEGYTPAEISEQLLVTQGAISKIQQKLGNTHLENTTTKKHRTNN